MSCPGQGVGDEELLPLRDGRGVHDHEEQRRAVVLLDRDYDRFGGDDNPSGFEVRAGFVPEVDRGILEVDSRSRTQIVGPVGLLLDSAAQDGEDRRNM